MPKFFFHFLCWLSLVVERKKEVILRSDISEAKPQIVDFSNSLNPGFLALFFFNCNEDSSVSFKVEVSEFNILDGTTKVLCFQKIIIEFLFLHFHYLWIIRIIYPWAFQIYLFYSLAFFWRTPPAL